MDKKKEQQMKQNFKKGMAGLKGKLEAEYKEAAEFYQSLTGQPGPKFKDFLNYYFQDIPADNIEGTDTLFKVNIEDIEEAREWLKARLPFVWVRKTIRNAAKGKEAKDLTLQQVDYVAQEWVEVILSCSQKIDKDIPIQKALSDIKTAKGKGQNKAFFEDCKKPILDELEKRLKVNSSAKKRGTKTKEAHNFEDIFISTRYANLAIQAMKEAFPKPLLNDEGQPVLAGRNSVAPIMALADAIHYRKKNKEGIEPKAIYFSICQYFGFYTSTRPDKARSEGDGIYQDYLKDFNLFFLNNRPE